ncbi:hypothetical protein F5Y07DRAFT_260627 [Xylaria sp. FL0933]|nr:hypothetical protein F5Y07DRAFT_260627 [Xylaria sp. FL0933]
MHVAASYELLEHTPGIEIHYASFAGRRDDVALVSSIVTRDFPSVNLISWHELPSPDYLAAVYRHIGNVSGMIFPPRLKGAGRQAAGMSFHLDLWETDEYFRLYKHVRELIARLDPAVVVLDMLLRPALDGTVHSKRNFAILSPSALVDTITARQP